MTRSNTPGRSPVSPSVGDHLATERSDYPSGSYRVVGADDERVTLLLVGDADGSRIHSGQVISVARPALDTFEFAEPPTPRRSAVESVRSGLSVSYWSLRANARQLAARPAQTTAVAVLLASGLLLDVSNLASESVTTTLVGVGSVLLVLVATGRLG